VNSLIEAIRLHKRKETLPPVSQHDWLRASGFAYTCLRYEALSAQEGVERTEKVDANMFSTFLLGTVMHTGMQSVLLRNQLIGAWRCFHCGHIHGGYPEWQCQMVYSAKATGPVDTPPHVRAEAEAAIAEVLNYSIHCPEVCESCQREATGEFGDFEYIERWVGDFELGIGGHPDGFLSVPWRKGIGIFEGKSISPTQSWKISRAPYVEHLYQVHIYMMITGCQWATILYWDKGVFGTSAFVEHLVERDDALIEEIRERILEYRASVESRGDLPRRSCAHAYCERAQKCDLVKVCFPQQEKVDVSS